MTSINFGANFVRSAQIQKLNNGTYLPYKASFVELIPEDDMAALSELDKMWPNSYAQSIYTGALCKSSNDFLKYYALTFQEDSFEKLDSNKVLGLVTFRSDNGIINCLQTSPNFKSEKSSLLLSKIKKLFSQKQEPQREYKNIGKAIIDSIRKTYPDSPIELFSANSAVNFYKKLGFKEDPPATRYMRMKSLNSEKMG